MRGAARLRDLCGRRLFVFCVLAGIFLAFSAGPVLAKVIPDKTPDDVFQKVMELSEKIQWLRRDRNVDDPWPELPEQSGKEPRHVLQKALEILAKINRYRLIKGMGAISTSHFPGRDITPNEVFSMVERLTEEIDLLLPPAQRGPKPHPPILNGHTPSHVYKALWEASRAMDPVLGIRGFNPSDVYAQSLRVVEMVKILRKSQNLPLDVNKPELGSGHHPNHALAAVYRLQKKVSQAEKALWMTPVEVPVVPRRVIIPTEVYDATEIVLAELQRIMYRLGLERDVEVPPTVPGKTPDDVIRNLEWAIRMMPAFPPDKPLIQYDSKLLRKTPNDVFALTTHILGELEKFRKVRGVGTKPRATPVVSGLEPRHVYQKTLEAMEKSNRLRKICGLSSSAVPRYPLRAITPTEVFDLMIRLDDALHVIFRKAGMSTRSYLSLDKLRKPRGKTPSDVYRNVWRISLLLDTVLGNKLFTPSDVYHEARAVLTQVRIVGKALGRAMHVVAPEKMAGIKPFDVYKTAVKLLALVRRAQTRSGMFSMAPSKIPVDGEVTPSQVFNMVRMIQTEITALKVHLGITVVGREPATFTGKEPADVLQVLEHARLMFEKIIRNEPAEGQSP